MPLEVLEYRVPIPGISSASSPGVGNRNFPARGSRRTANCAIASSSASFSDRSGESAVAFRYVVRQSLPVANQTAPLTRSSHSSKEPNRAASHAGRPAIAVHALRITRAFHKSSALVF